MSKLLELKSTRAHLWNDAKEFLFTHCQDDGVLSSEDEQHYRFMVEGVCALGDEIDRLTEQAKIDREIRKAEEERPVIGIKPYYVAAWQRIGALAEAIERQYHSPNGDTKLVQRWANEIGWQCSLIESLTDEDHVEIYNTCRE